MVATSLNIFFLNPWHRPVRMEKNIITAIKISNTKKNAPTLTKEEINFLLGKKEEKNVSDDKSR